MVEASSPESAFVESTRNPEVPQSLKVASDTWYLGIDIGTTGISATLLNRQTAQLYPIAWVETHAAQASLLRLPAIAVLSKALSDSSSDGVNEQSIALPALNQPESPLQELWLSHFKPYLNLGIPYTPADSVGEPELQWSDGQKLSLIWIQQALGKLLATLSLDVACTVEALDLTALRAALGQLAGVIVGCPTGWSDAYGFNIREAVLSIGLVSHPDQIFLIEEAIAALLAELPTSITDVRATSNLAQRQRTPAWEGSTLVISSGATMTELLLAELPPIKDELNYQALSLRSIDYAGDAIDQDIICQLLHPTARWALLHDLDLPLPGEPDRPARDRLQQRLWDSPLGQQLLMATRQLKQTLSQQDSTEFIWNNQHWMVTEQDLNSRVVLPYIQRLNRELNVLLTQTGTMVQAVRQIICTGGTLSLTPIGHWLKQKFPNAVLTQASLDSSQIACGLAKLPLYPQVLNSTRHQYSEYFLLRELVQVLPDQPLTLGRILQLLENQGIHTQYCQRTILDLLEGQLPAGLIPSKINASLLTPESRRNPDYQVLAAPLFSRQSNQVYALSPKLRQPLQQYLATLLANSHQTLKEPLLINLGVTSR